MEKTKFGNTNLLVSRFGVGMSELGYEQSQKTEAHAKEILSYALDSGINFLDTAACYGNGEELIGKSIANRRDEFVLST